MSAPPFSERVRRFAFKLFEQQTQKSPVSNTLISPIGISFLLSMIQEGVDEQTKEEIAEVAFLPKQDLATTVHATMQELKESQFDVAGLLYVHPKFQLNSSFAACLIENYESALTSGMSHLEINDWVSLKTAGQIREIVTEREMRQALLLLVNAIHFKAAWLLPFRPSSTYKEVFSAPQGDLLVPMMHATHRVCYLANHQCQAISLPYAESQAQLLLILPQDCEDLSWFHESALQDIIEALKPEKVKITLPKFSLKQEIDVKAILHRLGLQTLFQSADFSSMVDLEDEPSREALPFLKLTQMKQHLALEVDEKGTEASSVTSAMIAKSCARPWQEEPPCEIIFNRPFIAFLMNEGVPIFCGVIRDPIAAAP